MEEQSLIPSWLEYISYNLHYFDQETKEVYVDGIKLAMDMEFGSPKKALKKISTNGKRLCEIEIEKKIKNKKETKKKLKKKKKK